MATPPKKSKWRGLNEIKVGEKLVDIRLKVFDMEHRSINTKYGEREIVTLITTDGSEFAQVTAWGQHTVNVLREFTEDSIEKTYMFSGLECIAKNDYNFGSLPKEFLWKESSQASIIKLANDKITLDPSAYYRFLLQKYELRDANFCAVIPGKLKVDENLPNDFEFQIAKLSELKIVNVKGKSAKVCDVDLTTSDGGGRATLTGWNLFGSFLFNILKEHQGDILRLRSVYRFDQQKEMLRFVFSDSTRFSITERGTPNVMPTTLAELNELNGMVKMQVRLKVMRSPTLFDRRMFIDGTVATDGHHKCEFFYPSSIKLLMGIELIVSHATVTWSPGGVLSLHVHNAESVAMQTENAIPEKNLYEIDFPVYGTK